MRFKKSIIYTALLAAAPLIVGFSPAHAQAQKPNIIVIMGENIGYWNIGAYHRGMMAGADAKPRSARC
jgi:arylsulfatase